MSRCLLLWVGTVAALWTGEAGVPVKSHTVLGDVDEPLLDPLLTASVIALIAVGLGLWVHLREWNRQRASRPTRRP